MDFLKKKIIRLFFIGIIILFFNFSNIEASGWVHDTLPYRIGIQITKPTNTTSLNYAGIPIEKIINFQDYNFTNIDSSSLRITRNDGITKLPLQTEEWSNTNDTCLLIFQIHTADLNDATNTTVTYYLYFDLLSSGIKGQESYTTDLSITSAIRSDTLQNTFVRIIVLDTAVASTIIERTKSSPNLTQGGTGSNIWRNEGMYEIQEGSWWGLQHDTQWFRAHRTGPVKLTLIGTDIDFNNAVSPPRVKLTRKWKIYNNYPYFFVEDSARVANGPISTVDYDGAGDTYWKYSLYSDNLPNITYKNDTDYINVLASTSTLFNKPYWISMHSPSNYGRAVLIKSDYYTNGIFGLNVEKDVCCIGTNPNRCKFFLMNGNTGDINNYEFAFYVFGDTHNNTVIDNEWMKWNFPLTAQYTRLWRRNPIISNIQLKTSGGITTTELTPNSQMFLDFNVEDNDGFSDIDTITITIYNSRTSNLSASDNETNHITIKWIEAQDTWLLSDTLQWQINFNSCSSPGTANDTYTAQLMRLAFTPSKSALFETQPVWTINIKVESQNQSQTITDSINVSCAFYSEFQKLITHDTIIFDTGNPNAQYKNIISPETGIIVYNILTNGPYKLYARSQNFSISPSGELNLSNDSYLFVNFTNNTAAAIPINQPNTLILIDSSANYLNDTILNKSIYLWFTYPYQSQKIYQSLINFSITPYYTATINSADTLILQGATNEGSNPTIGEIKLFAGADTNTQTDTLTPNSKMTLLIPLSDKDKFYDIDTVTIKIFHNSFTSDDNDTDRYKITIYWHASNDSIFFANNNQNWQIDYSNSQTPGMNNQSFDTQYLKIVFIPSKIIKYTNNKDWRILVSASSYYPGEQVFSDTLNVACAFYSELKISPNNNGIFFKNDTGTIFNRLINPSAGAFDINIIANDSFAVILKSTNFVADSEILFVDSNAVFNYNFVNDTTTADSITTYNKLISPILNPTSYNGIDTNLYLWLNYGETNGQTYNGELLIAIVNNDDSGVSSSETIYLSGATIGGLDDPRILEIKLYDSNNNETNTLLPNTNMFIKIRVQEIDNGFDDIDTITFYIYHNSCTYLAQDTPALHSTFRWTANNDSWTLIGPLNSTWQINIDSCYAPAGSGDTASVEISLALRVGSTAKYDTQFNWIIMPVVESRTQSENAASFISVKSAFYCQLNFIDTIGIFPTNNPNTQNNALQTPNSYLRYYVISNGNYDIFYKSDNFTGGGGILVSQNNFTGYHLNNVNLSTPITNSYSAHKQNQTATSETGETQQLYLWLDYNYDTQTTYNGTLYLSIAPQSSANYYAVDTALISAATNAGSQPLISRPILYSDDNGGTTAISNILTPNNEMTLTFEIREFDGIIDIDTVFVYIWDSSAADSETNNTASSAIFMYYIDGAARKVISLTDNWSIDTIYSTAPPVNSISSDSQLFKLVFTPAKTINYRGANSWRIAVKAYSHSPDGYTYSQNLTVGDTIYAEIIINDTIAVFNIGAPQSLNNKLQYPYNGAIAFNLIVNAHLNLSIRADNFTSSGGGININSGNPLTYKISTDHTADTSITTTYSNVLSILPTSETGVNLEIYPYLDYPNTFAQTFNSQLYLQLDTAIISPIVSNISLQGFTNSAADPYIRSITLYSDDNGSTTTLTNTLTPNDTMTLAAVITDEDGWPDISEIEIHIYNTDYASINSTPSEKYYAVYKWQKSTNNFSLVAPVGNTFWAIDTNNCTFFDPYPYDNNFNVSVTPNSNWSTNNFFLADTRYTSPPYSAKSTTGANINDTLQVITRYNSTSVLTFRWWLVSENNKDRFWVKVNGVNAAGFPVSGNQSGFWTTTINLNSGVNTILFNMTSDNKNHFENVYIDDVKVRPNSFAPNFKLVFKPSKFAEFAASSKWRIDMIVKSSTQSNNARLFNDYPCTFYAEINTATDTIYFDTGNPNSILNPIIYANTNYYPINILANANFNLGIYADTFTGGSGISLYQNKLGIDTGENNNWQQRAFLKPDTQYLFTNISIADTNYINKKLYLWLDYPNQQNTKYYSNLRFAAIPIGTSYNYYIKKLNLEGGTDYYSSAIFQQKPDTIYTYDTISAVIIDTDAVQSRYHIDSFWINIKTILTNDSEYFKFSQLTETSIFFYSDTIISTEYNNAAVSNDSKLQIIENDTIIITYTDLKNNNTLQDTIPVRNIFTFITQPVGCKEINDTGLILHIRIINNHFLAQTIDTITLTTPTNTANISYLQVFSDANNNDTFSSADNLLDSKTLSANTVTMTLNITIPQFADTDIFVVYKLVNNANIGDTIDFYIDTNAIISLSANRKILDTILNSIGYDTIIPKIILTGKIFLEGKTDHTCTVYLILNSDTQITISDTTGVFLFNPTFYDTYILKIEQLAYIPHQNTIYVDTDVINLPTIILLGGDLNQSGKITIEDLGILMYYFGKQVDSPLKGDINNSGWVTEDDYSILIKNLE